MAEVAAPTAPAAPGWKTVILAGGMSGMMVDFVLFPLDSLKTYLQTRTELRNQSGLFGQGSKRFYRGLASAMLGSFPGAATFWTSYELAKQITVPRFKEHGEGGLVAAHALSAATADIAVTLVRNPFEVVKQQMQAGIHRSMVSAVTTIVRRDGVVRGLYAGYLSTVAREVPFDAIEFVLYEHLKSIAVRHRRRDLVLWENALLGSIAGGVAAAVTTPLDVVKTRLMTQAGSTGGADRYKGWVDAFRRIPREEGVGALFRGIRPRVMFISIGGAIFIGSFEEFKRRLSDHRAR